MFRIADAQHSATCLSQTPAASLPPRSSGRGWYGRPAHLDARRHRPALALVDQARTGAWQSTAGQRRGLGREPALGSWSPKSLNDQLREAPKTFGAPHENPTSLPPGRDLQTSHFSGGRSSVSERHDTGLRAADLGARRARSGVSPCIAPRAADYFFWLGFTIMSYEPEPRRSAALLLSEPHRGGCAHGRFRNLK
jgi:hypothetical protein